MSLNLQPYLKKKENFIISIVISILLIKLSLSIIIQKKFLFQVFIKKNYSKKILISGIYKKELLKKNFFNITKFSIAKDIKSIKILNLNRYDVYLKNNVYVKLGDYDINLQMKTLTQIMKKYQNLNTIDLRNKGRAVIK